MTPQEVMNSLVTRFSLLPPKYVKEGGVFEMSQYEYDTVLEYIEELIKLGVPMASPRTGPMHFMGLLVRIR